MKKKFLPKLVIATVLVGGVNFSPAVVNFDINNNLQIISVAYAEIQNVTASDTAMFDFGEDNEKIVNLVKNVAKMRAEQSAKEKAGVYVSSFSRSANGILTDDDISAYTSNNIEILNVTYKKIPYQAHDAKGNDTGKVGVMYEATVTAKIDTSNLSAYMQLDSQEKKNIVLQNINLSQSLNEVNKDFEDLRKNSKNKKSLKIDSDITKLENKLLAVQKMEEASKFHNEGNYQAAISKYTESINISPEIGVLYLSRGESYYKLKKYNKAFDDYKNALLVEKNDEYKGIIYSVRGERYLELKKYNEALENCNSAIQITKDTSHKCTMYMFRAIVYDEMKNYDAAISDYDKFIELCPEKKLPLGYKMKGRIHFEQKKYIEAIEDCNKGTEIAPQDVDFYFILGLAYSAIGKFDEAIDGFSHAIEIHDKNDKDLADLYASRGYIYRAIGETEKALADLKKAKQLGYNY